MNDNPESIPSLGETQTETKEPNTLDTTQGLKPGVAEAAADVFRDLITNMGALHQSTEKAHTSFIAYMDRIILLAGGTLTLTFTAVATLSAHLRDSHHTATHIQFVTVACWLLVATIFLGLSYNKYTIKLRHQEGLQSTLTMVDAQTKLKLLSLPWISSIDGINAVPPLVDPKTLEQKIKYLRRGAAWAGLLSQITLVVAFVFLTLFIQSNIIDMLSQ